MSTEWPYTVMILSLGLILGGDKNPELQVIIYQKTLDTRTMLNYSFLTNCQAIYLPDNHREPSQCLTDKEFHR